MPEHSAVAEAGQGPLRILLLAPQPFFEVRGTPLAVRAMLRALSELGHSVDLLTYPQGEDITITNVRHRRSARLPVGHVRPGFSLAKLALDVPFMLEAWGRIALGRYDVVHAVEEAAHLAAPVAAMRGLPLVMDVDSSIPEQLGHAAWPLRGWLPRLVRALERRALHRAAVTITVCTSLTEAVHRLAPSTSIFQIEDPPLVDGTQLAGPAQTDALRTSLGIQAGMIALYSGNFESYQGVDLLVDATARLPNVTTIFMGGEPAEVLAMKARAADHGCAHRCVFVGKQPPTELPAYLALADVLVSPRCRGQNTPFKIYTYLASGRPMVATRIPSHTQFLDDSLAVLVDASPEGLAQGIDRVLADPLAALERAVRGRALIERDYGPRAFQEKVRRAYVRVQRAVATRGEGARAR
jgi:glycosyltransferase involved in cell wall biosynthesis